MSVFPAFAHLVEQLADLIQPLFGATAAAAAIVLFTALVRLLVHPLSRAAARGQKARTALQPKITELRTRHKDDPRKFQQALLDLHAEEKVSPVSGCLPGLLQLPAFFLLYHLFSNATVGGERNALLAHQLFAAPLGGRWVDALSGGGVFGAAGLVYVGLFAVVAVVASFTYRRTKRATALAAAATDAATDAVPEPIPGAGAIGRVMPFMSFFTLITVAVVPLAAALYVVTSTTWAAVERALLSR